MQVRNSMIVRKERFGPTIRQGRKEGKPIEQQTQRELVLWIFSVIPFAVASWLLFESASNGSMIGVLIGSTWLVNIVIGSRFIKRVLTGNSAKIRKLREKVYDENVND